MDDMLENFRLKVFRTVAEHLNFRKAGEQLFLSQPAVTLQIKALEDELGIAVFERSGAGVRLTAAGMILLDYAKRLCQLAEEAESSLAALQGEVSGKLALGASTTIAQYVLPRQLAAFARRFPATQLQVFSQNTEHIVEGVAARRYALGLIEGPALRRDVKVSLWFEDELVIAVPTSHEWAGKEAVEAEQLRTMPFVMRERGSGSRHAVEQGLQKAGIRPRSLQIAMELDSTEAILSCIEAGLGVGIVSRWALARRIESGSLAAIQMEGHRMTRDFSFVLSQEPQLSRPVETLMRFLQSAAPAMSHPSGKEGLAHFLHPSAPQR
jgi:LysR family transcriptional regulator, transcriptional activator of the cysJI operon